MAVPVLQYCNLRTWKSYPFRIQWNGRTGKLVVINKGQTMQKHRCHLECWLVEHHRLNRNLYYDLIKNQHKKFLMWRPFHVLPAVWHAMCAHMKLVFPPGSVPSDRSKFTLSHGKKSWQPCTVVYICHHIIMVWDQVKRIWQNCVTATQLFTKFVLITVIFKYYMFICLGPDICKKWSPLPL
jgi:hypothetical protein